MACSSERLRRALARSLLLAVAAGAGRGVARADESALLVLRSESAPASAPASSPLLTVAGREASLARYVGSLRARYATDDPAAIQLAIRFWPGLPSAASEPAAGAASEEAPPATAPAADDALDLFEQAADRFDEGDWGDAIELLRACYARVANPDLLFLIALTEQGAGDGSDALGSYEDFLASAPDDDPLVGPAEQALSEGGISGAAVEAADAGSPLASDERSDPLATDLLGFLLQMDVGVAGGLLDSRWLPLVGGGDARVELPIARPQGLWAYGDAAIGVADPRSKNTLDPVLGTHPRLEIWSLGGGLSWRYRLAGYRGATIYFAPSAGAAWGLCDYSPAAKGPAYARYENLTLDLDPAFLLIAGHLALRASVLALDVIRDNHYDASGSSWMDGAYGLRSGGVVIEILRLGVGGYL